MHKYYFEFKNIIQQYEICQVYSINKINQCHKIKCV